MDVSSSCRLCGERSVRKYYFFSEKGKSVQLKKIIWKVCEVQVEESDELPRFCCRSCYDKLLRLNKNSEAFAEVCRKTQKELEAQISKKRTRTEEPVSSEKPCKRVFMKTTTTAKKSLTFMDKQQVSNTMDTVEVEEKEVGHVLILKHNVIQFYKGLITISLCFSEFKWTRASIKNTNSCERFYFAERPSEGI